jgi:virginiamycin A acetyltransferase
MKMSLFKIAVRLGRILLPERIQSYVTRRYLLQRHGLHVGTRNDYQIIESNFGRNCRIGAPNYIAKSDLGDFSYVEPYCRISDTKVGKFCSIAAYSVLGPPDHPLERVSTHPAFFLRIPEYGYNFDVEEFQDTAPTIIGNDVWIGSMAVIKRGIQIGNGAVVGAGAVVTKNVPPYSIVAGAPARIVRYRFKPELIEKIMASEWWDRDERWLRKYAPHFANSAAFVERLELESAEKGKRLQP